MNPPISISVGPGLLRPHGENDDEYNESTQLDDHINYIQWVSHARIMTVMLSSMKPLFSPGWGRGAIPRLKIFSTLAALAMSCWTMLKLNDGILFLHSWRASLASLHASRVLTILLAISLSINVQGSVSSWARLRFQSNVADAYFFVWLTDQGRLLRQKEPWLHTGQCHFGSLA